MGAITAGDAPTRAHVRNVVLTGFLGTGKSTSGRLLAGRLGATFVDTDDLIEREHGPIDRIFSDQGEAEFRRIERAVAEELSERDGLVISTGGRLMLDARNAEVLGADAHVFCLTASVDTIVARVEADRDRVDRPLLVAKDVRARIAELLTERAEGYGQFIQVDTGGRTPAHVVDDIVARIDAIDAIDA
jgi:shikimate kinase